MNKLKEFLIRIFGKLGFLLFEMIAYFFQFAPLIILRFPFLIFCVVFFVICFVPILGTVVNLVVWIWALVVSINGPQDALAITYYVLFGINALYVLASVLSAFAPRGR
ncbi:MAG: hypothetical protein ACI3W5_13220 [Faecousia sp.]